MCSKPVASSRPTKRASCSTIRPCALPISAEPDITSQRSAALAVAASLLAALLFGTTGTILVNAPAGADAYSVGCLRLAIGGLTLIAVSKRSLRTARLGGWHALGAFGVAVFQLGYFVAVERTGVAIGTVVTIGSGPALSGLIDASRTRRVPSAMWLVGTTVSVAGVAVLGAFGRSTSANLAGICLAVLAGLGWATFSDSAKRLIDNGANSTATMAAFFAGGAVLMSPFLFTHSPRWAMHPSGLAVALVLGVATVGIAYTSYGWALRHLSAPTVITLTLLEPITAALLAAVVVHEGIRAAGWAGIAAVLAGLTLTAQGALRSRSTPTATVGS
jgi:DME family drug/metabolite transporter